MNKRISLLAITFSNGFRRRYFAPLRLGAGLVAVAVAVAGGAHPTAQDKSGTVLIRAGRLIDVRNGRVLSDQGILIEGERIKQVGPMSQVQSIAGAAPVIDLSPATVMPD